MGYKRVAVRGSILYFVIADMARINDMYQNSLEYVKVLFNKAIDMTPKSDELETRLDSLIDVSTKTIFTNVSRGLFSRDKLIFSFLICTSIDRNNLEINNVAWNIMLRGAIPISDAQKLPKTEQKWNKNIRFSDTVQKPNSFTTEPLNLSPTDNCTGFAIALICAFAASAADPSVAPI